MSSSILQTLFVAIFAIYVLFINLGILHTIFLMICPPLFPVLILYLTLIYLFDRNVSKRGGRPSPFLRNLKIWKYLSDYFPAKVILQEPLDPSKKYIFASHPHGLFIWGLWANFMNNSNNIDGLLKDIPWRLLTLDPWFWIPWVRELYMALGFASVSKESCDYLLDHGIAPLIVVGGAEEAIDARPGTNKLILKRRKGFIKLALQHGANLVPMFTFGENEVYHPVWNSPGSLFRRFQLWVKGKTILLPTYFPGRGYLAFPMRHELITVIGSPIEVKKKASFDEKDVNELHQKYIEVLTALYNEYADKYAKGVKLVIE